MTTQEGSEMAEMTAEQLKERAREAREQAKLLVEKAEQLRIQSRKAELTERREREAAEAKAHYERMYTEIGQPLAGLNKNQHDVVYSQAYSDGHSAGFSEVESRYGDLAELARKVIEAN